ncbi:MAG TPA: universal stress protein [Pseudolabrys sp.]|nr:universal stress protein [Pseudolabrys sp.]
MLEIRSIVHPTDFSEASADAFAHALRIALNAKATLTLLHVPDKPRSDDWDAFPHVRRTLADWGLLDPNAGTDAIERELGIAVRKVEMEPQSPLDGIRHFLRMHAADLIVLSTEGRQGAARWLSGSVAEDVARATRAPSLFVPAKARGFVDLRRGEVHLKHVLIPVDHEPKPAEAIGRIMSLAHLIAGENAEERLLHVGEHRPPQVQRHSEPHRLLPVAVRKGDPVETILDVANDWPADLIGMPTAGHHGFLDALRGSTTERVLRQAPCPVLAVPALAR